METNLLDVISELERIRDDLSYSDPEDIEDTAPYLCNRLEWAIDALYSMSKEGNQADEQ